MKTDSLSIEKVLEKIDSLNYDETDFNKMTEYYIKHKEINNMMSQKASEGDKNAAEFLEILKLPFDEAINRVGKQDIYAIIHVFYLNLELEKKFNKLNRKLDSEIRDLNKEKEYYKNEIDQDKKLIDSLKKN
ncbi:hypothetical protein [Flavivirga spongiicola]|uniref:Uncharacterized protein n=1 Tax=Flavivirga spongiicola TaxID=421621 RepID=A0ABU7XTW6_9FLAO|nr:hypothetical protein [Flavivirga sp. MEBiC05379]MDO5979198.1 hypothetical protein [Flavivirga sp. MEBiC05379]